MIVLDTHVWIWLAANSKKLSVRARKAVDEADKLGVCTISCWEVAMLEARGRIEFDRDIQTWLRQALALPKLELLPLTPDIAVEAANLPDDFPGDPADRLIAASAICHRTKLITKDKKLRAVKSLATTW